MSTPQPPSADQLATARLAHWRQNAVSAAEAPAAALLTLDSVRNFVSSCGLLLFAPRPQLIPSPAPSLVEATLGMANSAPTLAESAVARTLLARLIAEGSAVPLNLLGAPSTTPDAPDFIASAATFSYIFTLRGDKAFKQPPSTSGATKVSPLALNTYNLLVEKGPTSAYDLVTQLGKEVTEAAVLRSLSELWQHLRVLPVPQADGGATLWETVANRFTKQLKAGANAGQPTALSALISLYLSQSLLATENDVETFLSPLAPRSRVRDVLHALTGARQLETIAIDGKTHLHIHGELPQFLAPADSSDSEQHLEPDTAAVELAEDGTRIKKFIAKPRKVGTGYVERAKPFTSRPAREARPFDRKAPPSRDRESRPFSKPAGKFAGRSAGTFSPRPAFNKPWDEEKQQRAAREAAPASDANSGDQLYKDIDLDANSPTAAATPPRPASRPSKPPFAAKSRFGGDRPAFGRKPAPGGDRPAYRSDRPSPSRDSGSEARPPRRDFTPRDSADSRPPRRDFSASGKPSFSDRKPYSKPGFGDRKREGFTSRPGGDRPAFNDRGPASNDRGPASNDKEPRPFRRDESAPESRPPRRDFAPRSGDAPGRPPRRDFAPRSGDGHARPPRRDFAPRSDSSAGESFSKPRFPRARQDGDAPGESSRPDRPAFRKFDAPRGPRKPFTPREGGESRPPRRDSAGSGKSFSGPGKPPFGAGRRDDRSGPGTGSGSREGGFPGKREGSGYAGKKPFSAASGSSAAKKKSFSGKPAGRRGPDAPGVSTFDKFKGGNKPWGKRPPGRKPKPEGGEA